ncbi:MAG: hypothetical protein ABMB14_39845 [Myxococcota bacterium]
MTSARGWLRWDAAVVGGCLAAVLGAAALRGVPGLGGWIALVVAIDLGYLAIVAWNRR